MDSSAKVYLANFCTENLFSGVGMLYNVKLNQILIYFNLSTNPEYEGVILE